MVALLVRCNHALKVPLVPNYVIRIKAAQRHRWQRLTHLCCAAHIHDYVRFHIIPERGSSTTSCLMMFGIIS